MTAPMNIRLSRRDVPLDLGSLPVNMETATNGTSPLQQKNASWYRYRHPPMNEEFGLEIPVLFERCILEVLR